MSSEVSEAIKALPSAFLPEKAGNTKASFQLDLTGADGGQWTLDVADGKCEVREETAAQPDVTLTMDANDFVAFFRNELDPIQAFMGGKIKVSGNLGLVMQLMNWFDRG
jgi:putative sterol carrier protein